MAAPRGRGLWPGGVVRTAVRLVLLVGLGFGAGLVMGILSEEPELLVGHLRGESEPVFLTKGRLTESGVPREASLPEAKAAAGSGNAVEPVPETIEESEASLPVVAAAPRDSPVESRESVASKSRWAIQVGAFSDRAMAARLAEDLQSKGYPVELVPATKKADRWRVRVQPVEGEARARALSTRLEQEERLPTWRIAMEARPDS